MRDADVYETCILASMASSIDLDPMWIPLFFLHGLDWSGVLFSIVLAFCDSLTHII